MPINDQDKEAICALYEEAQRLTILINVFEDMFLDVLERITDECYPSPAEPHVEDVLDVLFHMKADNGFFESTHQVPALRDALIDFIRVEFADD